MISRPLHIMVVGMVSRCREVDSSSSSRFFFHPRHNPCHVISHQSSFGLDIGHFVVRVCVRRFSFEDCASLLFHWTVVPQPYLLASANPSLFLMITLLYEKLDLVLWLCVFPGVGLFLDHSKKLSLPIFETLPLIRSLDFLLH